MAQSTRKAAVLCTVYVSEARELVLRRLSGAVEGVAESLTLHRFVDTQYARTSFLLAGRNVVQGAVALCSAAFESIDFASHGGTHPSLGTVDHVCFSPLGDCSLEDAAHKATEFAQAAASQLSVPVYTYGAANRSGARLRDIRRALGYFDVHAVLSDRVREARPPYGSSTFDLHRGIMCVGATHYVLNFNVRVRSGTSFKEVAALTKRVRERDGGLPYVEALTLKHEDDSLEVACNLLRPKITGPDVVLSAISAAARERGIEIAMSYTTNPLEIELLRMIK